ncbi:MAG: hypothetical protein EOO73_11600 [Myxococcales bacterium]|nr:MAG: hypothetical protein EOO73_11600 [Myxococcales bacterium]
MSSLSFAFALAWLALSCGARGVSLGSEEPCVVDAQLLAARDSSPGESLPVCSTIGLNQLVNPGMENPLIGSVSDCPSDFCQVAASRVLGWRTTSEAQVIEVWADGYWGVPAAEGGQFIELDADTPDTLYQDLVLMPGELVYWSIRHRGRLGEESIEVLLGPPESPRLQGALTTSTEQWREYSGLYRVGADESVTRFSLASRSGTSQGNLVDLAVLAPVESGQ